MSSNRGWTTCHDINDKRYGGEHLHGLTSALRNGSLIAYLIRKDDKNINNPIARCLIKRNSYSSKLSYYLDHHVYGTRVDAMTKFLKKWCEDFNTGLVNESAMPLDVNDIIVTSLVSLFDSGFNLEKSNIHSGIYNLVRGSIDFDVFKEDFLTFIDYINENGYYLSYYINIRDRDGSGKTRLITDIKSTEIKEGKVTEINLKIRRK